MAVRIVTLLSTLLVVGCSASGPVEVSCDEFDGTATVVTTDGSRNYQIRGCSDIDADDLDHPSRVLLSAVAETDAPPEDGSGASYESSRLVFVVGVHPAGPSDAVELRAPFDLKTNTLGEKQIGVVLADDYSGDIEHDFQVAAGEKLQIVSFNWPSSVTRSLIHLAADHVKLNDGSSLTLDASVFLHKQVRPL